MTRLYWAVSVGLVLSTACATSPRVASVPLRADGPHVGKALVYSSPRLPTGAMAALWFEGDGYAILAQAVDGRVTILFPTAENRTGRVPRRERRRNFYIDTSAGPVFLVAAREPMHLGTLQDAVGYLDWYSKGPQTEEPDALIQRFAAEVADNRVTIVRAGREELGASAPLPSSLRRSIEEPGRTINGTCRTAPSHVRGQLECIRGE